MSTESEGEQESQMEPLQTPAVWEVGRAQWAPQYFSKQKIVTTLHKTTQKLLQDFNLLKKFPPTHRNAKFTFMLIFFSFSTM